MEQMFPSKSQTWKCLPIAEKSFRVIFRLCPEKFPKVEKKTKLESIEQQKDPGRNNVQHYIS